MNLKKMLLVVLALLPTLNAGAQIWGKVAMPIVDGSSAIFRIDAPKAQTVKLYGDFLPGVNEYGLGGSVEMARGENGVWEYKAENLAPEFYFYYYDIDGVRTLDPSNLQVAHNFAEYLNTFIIQGEESSYYEIATQKKGSLTQQWYYSSAIGAERRMNVYLPYGYTTDKKYPVLYLQHGGGDDEENWVDMGRACQILDHLIADGKAEEMIVVMPNSFDNQLASMRLMNPLNSTSNIFGAGARQNSSFRSGGKYVQDLVECIIPFVESHFSVKTDRGSRAISGLSMGGVYTLYTIEKYPELFSYIGIMGMGYEATTDVEEALSPIRKEGYNLFWIGCGQTDIAHDNAVRLMNALDEREMKYTYFDSNDGHNWRSWRRDLLSLSVKLFK